MEISEKCLVPIVVPEAEDSEYSRSLECGHVEPSGLHDRVFLTITRRKVSSLKKRIFYPIFDLLPFCEAARAECHLDARTRECGHVEGSF